MTETASEVIVEVRDRVMVITLNRPEAMNSVNSALGAGLVDAIAHLDADDDVRVGVITGAGRGFSAGMDLKAFATEGPPRGFGEFLRNGSRKPLIAAIEGFALAGGLEIALTCDLLVAAAGAKLGIPEVTVGLYAAGGAVYRLPNRVPYGVAMEMGLTGKPIRAEQALEYGLVSRVVEPGTAVGAAVELATTIAANAPLSTAVTKLLINAGRGMTDEEFWSFQSQHMDIFTSADAREGAMAFVEKRAPNWTGS